MSSNSSPPATPSNTLGSAVVGGASSFHTPASSRRSPEPGGSATRTPDSVGRRRAQLLAEHGGYWKAWRLAIEFKRLAAEDLPGFYALPNMVDASRWHALLILPPKVIQPSPYAEAVLRISFEFPELYGEEGTQPQDSVISVFVSSAPFYHPLVDNSSGSFHIPARLLPKDKPADGVVLAKIIRKAFSSAFLDTLVPEDLNDPSEPGTRRGNPDAMDMLLSDRATFDMIAQQTAEQSASEDALYEAATADGELRIRRAKWTEQELDDAMDRLELAMQPNQKPQTSPQRSRTILSSIKPKFGVRRQAVAHDDDDSIMADFEKIGRGIGNFGQKVMRSLME